MSDESDGLIDADAGTVALFKFADRFALVGMTTKARTLPQWNADAARLSVLAKLGPPAMLRESEDDHAPESSAFADEALELMERYAAHFPEEFLDEYFDVLADAGFQSEHEPIG